MQSVTIDVNPNALSFVKSLGFKSFGEYVNLNLANQMFAVQKEEDELEELHKLLDEGDASGYVSVDENFWKNMDARCLAIRKRHGYKD